MAPCAAARSAPQSITCICRDVQIADFVLGLDAPAPKHEATAPPPWPTERLKRYIAWARATFQPRVSAAAQEVLLAYFQKQRSMAALVYAPTERLTVRFLESLVRLSQAHARLMARHTVEAADAAAALLLVDTCAHVTSTLNMRYSAPPHCICELADVAHAAAVDELLRSLGLAHTELLPPPAPPPALHLPDPPRAVAPAPADSEARPALRAVQPDAALRPASADLRTGGGGAGAPRPLGSAGASQKRAFSSQAALCVPTQHTKRGCLAGSAVPTQAHIARRAHSMGATARFQCPGAAADDDDDVDLSELDHG